MSTWEEMKQQIGFTREDARLLRSFHALVEPHVPELVTFLIERYGSLLPVPTDGGPQEETTRAALFSWILDFFLGDYGIEYSRRRQRMGRLWVRLALPERDMFMAISCLRTRFCDLSTNLLPPSSSEPTSRAIHRILDMDLALFVSAYLKYHETLKLRSMQDLMIRSLSTAVLCLDSSGRVQAATRVSPAIIERASLGTHFEAFLRADLVEGADLPTLLGKSLATGQEVIVPRFLLGSGPDSRHLRIRIVPLENELTPIILHIEDITDVVLAESRAQQAESLARIGSLAANIAHEIRNPLTAISTTVQVISASLDASDRRRSILLKLQEQVLRLDRLVSDLLAYARPAKIAPQPHELGAMTREIVTLSGLRASLEIIEPARALVDPSALQNILLNLLQNARESAGSDGRVLVRVGPGPTLLVADDGPGIAPEIRNSLFDPFVTTRSRGTGLGLAISRKLAEAMAAELTLEEPPQDAFVLMPAGRGPGAAFRLTLPSLPAGDHASPVDNAGHNG